VVQFQLFFSTLHLLQVCHSEAGGRRISWHNTAWRDSSPPLRSGSEWQALPLLLQIEPLL